MSTLRFRLFCVIALALVGGVVSQSAGATNAGGASGFRAAGAAAQWPGARQMPMPRGFGAVAPGVHGSALSSLATASSFTNIGIDFGSTEVYSATWADYDSDGRLDLLALGADYPPDYSTLPVAVSKLYHNNGDGTFSEKTTSGLPALFGAVASWADYDSDGHIDVLIAGCSDVFCPTVVSKLYHNNGDGTFSEDTRAGLAGVRANNDMITWADYDADGRPDLLLTGVSALSIASTSTGASIAPASTTRLYHNNGDGTFSENTHASFSGNDWFMSAWSDYDADGFPDLLLSGIDPTSSASVSKLFHNNGDGTFSEDTAAHLPGAIGLFWGWISWGDYNGDGFDDILINGSPGISMDSPAVSSATTRLYRNNGDGTFSEDTAAGLPSRDDAQLIWGDYNGDGRLDVVVNGCPGSCFDTDYVTELYLNDGDGTFSKDANSGLPADFAWLGSGDYNSDGRLDLLVWETRTPGNNGVYRNDAAAAATPPDSPTRFESHLLRGGVVKLSWRVSASKTLDNSLSYNLRVGTTPGGSDVVSPLAGPSGVRQVAEYGNTGGRNFALLKGLRPGTYYWSVQSVGANYAGSSFALQHDFVIAPTPTLRLLRTKIYACKAGPRTTKVFGKVSPSYYAASVALQTRFADGAGWRAVARKTLSSPGTYRFGKVGKGVARSFWLRVRIRSKLGTVVTRSAHVIVQDAAACAKPKAGAKS